LTGRILGSYARLAEQTTNHLSAPSSIYFTKTATRSLQENPGSIQVVMFLASIQALGLSVPPADYGVYPGIFRSLIRPSRCHGSCISFMSISLKLTVLVRSIDAALLCCRLAKINGMLITTSNLAYHEDQGCRHSLPTPLNSLSFSY
jgi:hypothetical protein